MSPLLTQILLALLFISIGFVAGVIVTHLWLERENTTKPGEINQAVREATTGLENKSFVLEEQAFQEKVQSTSEPVALKLKNIIVPNPIDQGKAAQKTTTQSKSIVLQVDDILQEMITRDDLSRYGLRLTEDAKQGVIVWLGVERYYGISAVPDPEVRSIIQAAVAEWERRTGEK